MSQKIITYFDGKEIKVPEELKGHKPTEVTLILSKDAEETNSNQDNLPLLTEMIALSKRLKGKYPNNLAENHDYYLHGRPKK